MELRQLRNFLTVAETLNISAAARKLHVTQPALSRQILDLENELTHALFLRERGKLKLTPAGAVLRTRGAKAVAALDDALRSARAAAAQTAAVLRVGYYGTTWAVLVEPALKKLRRQFPRLDLSLSEASPSELAADLGHGRLDVVVLNRNPKWERKIVAVPVARVPMLVAMPPGHALAGKQQLALQDLRKERVVSYTRQVGFGRDRPFISACRKAGFAPKISYEADTLSSLLLLVGTQRQIALVTSMALHGPLPGVVVRPLKPSVCLEIYAAHSRNATPAARRLVELIAAEGHRAVSTS